MNNFWTTVLFTAGSRLKSKTFLITTVIIAVLIVGALNFDQLVQRFAGEESTEVPQIAVIDETASEGAFAELLESREDGAFNYIHVTEEDVDTVIALAEQSEYEYVLSLQGTMEDLEAALYGDGIDFTERSDVNQDVQSTKEAVLTAELDISEEEVALIFQPVSFSEYPLHIESEGQTGTTEESHMQVYWIVYGLVFAIYMIVIILGTMIATEVASEKSSRVMELIVSSVHPVTQMLGKLFGIGLVGLVNIGFLIGAALLGLYISGDDFLANLFNESLDFSLILYAVVLVVLGYFVYGGTAAMLGALVSRAEEVNQALQPLIIVAMLAFFVAIFGLNTPDATYVHVLSYIPFFTPQLLFLRLGMGTVPVWEIALIMAILVGSAIVINMVAARIYKGGVLMYGKFSFKEGMSQALKMSKKES